MKRESLKLRAWDSELSEMSTSDLYQYDDMLGFSFNHFGFNPSEDVTYMLFTGLQDLKGNDIYEGDIIKYHQHNSYALESFTAEIRYIESYACFGYLKLGLNEFGFDHVVIHPFSEHDEFGVDVSPYFEVIGNIYQNPELLVSEI